MVIRIGLQDCCKPRAKVTVPCPVRLWQWILNPPTSSTPVQVKVSVGLTTFSSSAIDEVMILNVDPGSYSSVIALLLHITCRNSARNLLYSSLSFSMPQSSSAICDSSSST